MIPLKNTLDLAMIFFSQSFKYYHRLNMNTYYVQLLPSRGRIYFPHPFTLDWLCDLLWLIECSISDTV